MPDFTIADQNTEQIINREQATLANSDESAVLAYILFTDADIRLVTGDQKEHARHGFEVKAQTTTTIDPRGHEIHAFADGAEATINVMQMRFVVGEGAFG